MIGYCFKCRCDVEMVGREGEPGPKAVTMRNGRPATEGRCGTCGTLLHRLGHEKPAAARQS